MSIADTIAALDRLATEEHSAAAAGLAPRRILGWNVVRIANKARWVLDGPDAEPAVSSAWPPGALRRCAR